MTSGKRDLARSEITIGQASDWFEGRVDGDAAIAFALATNDPNEAYLSGAAVPPMMTAALIQPAFADSADRNVDPGAITGYRATVQAEHDVYFHAPIRAGEAIKWRAATRSARQTPAGVLLTQQIWVTDIHETLLVEHLWSTIYIGGSIGADLGPDLPDHTFPEPARSTSLGRQVFDITPDQTFRYGGVSGDRVPHSMDDEAARADGFPGKILQGQCIFAMCSGAVVNLAAAGDPNSVLRLAGRFSAPVFPRQKLEVKLYEVHSTDDRRVLAFEATSGGDTVIKHGLAELS